MGSKDSGTTVELKITIVDGQTYTLRVNKCISVPALKEQIASVTGVSSDQQRLICNGKFLEDNQLLSAHRVEDGHTVHLIVRQPHQSEPIVISDTDSQGLTSSASDMDSEGSGSTPSGHSSEFDLDFAHHEGDRSQENFQVSSTFPVGSQNGTPLLQAGVQLHNPLPRNLAIHNARFQQTPPLGYSANMIGYLQANAGISGSNLSQSSDFRNSTNGAVLASTPLGFQGDMDFEGPTPQVCTRCGQIHYTLQQNLPIHHPHSQQTIPFGHAANILEYPQANTGIFGSNLPQSTNSNNRTVLANTTRNISRSFSLNPSIALAGTTLGFQEDMEVEDPTPHVCSCCGQIHNTLQQNLPIHPSSHQTLPLGHPANILEYPQANTGISGSNLPHSRNSNSRTVVARTTRIISRRFSLNPSTASASTAFGFQDASLMRTHGDGSSWDVYSFPSNTSNGSQRLQNQLSAQVRQAQQRQQQPSSDVRVILYQSQQQNRQSAQEQQNELNARFQQNELNAQFQQVQQQQQQQQLPYDVQINVSQSLTQNHQSALEQQNQQSAQFQQARWHLSLNERMNLHQQSQQQNRHNMQSEGNATGYQGQNRHQDS